MTTQPMDLSAVDPTQLDLTREGIMEILPHREHMLQLDGIVSSNPETREAIGIRHVRAEEFWTDGHFPGQPTFPGVLMVESAAQMTIITWKLCVPTAGNVLAGFGGIDKVRFRGVVRPGNTLLFGCRLISAGGRAARSMNWCYLNGKQVFEGEILGVRIPSA